MRVGFGRPCRAAGGSAGVRSGADRGTARLAPIDRLRIVGTPTGGTWRPPHRVPRSCGGGFVAGLGRVLGGVGRDAAGVASSGRYVPDDFARSGGVCVSHDSERLRGIRKTAGSPRWRPGRPSCREARHFTSHVAPERRRSSTQRILLAAFTSSTCRSTAASYTASSSTARITPSATG